MSNGLNPCPFCGAKPYISQGETKYYLKHKYECYFYGKHNHDVQPVAFANDSDAIASWNTRPIEDALRKEIAQLQADNRSLVEQMNQMALKPNQEVIEWVYTLYNPEINIIYNLPTEDRLCIIELFSGKYDLVWWISDGWDGYCVDEVKSWAYLPIGKNYLKAQDEQ